MTETNYEKALRFAGLAHQYPGQAQGTTYATLAGAYATLAEVDELATPEAPSFDGFRLHPTPIPEVVAEKAITLEHIISFDEASAATDATLRGDQVGVRLRLDIRVESNGRVSVHEDGAPSTEWNTLYAPTSRVFLSHEVAELMDITLGELEDAVAKLDESEDDEPVEHLPTMREVLADSSDEGEDDGFGEGGAFEELDMDVVVPKAKPKKPKK